MSRPSAAIDHEKSDMARVLEQMDEMPLFMKGLTSSAVDDNPTLSALQSLVYDGEPFEVASNFKTQGNEAFAQRQWRNAVEYYTKGLSLAHEQPVGEWTELKHCLHLNRAAANLKLENYRKVIDDTAQVLKEDAGSRKALYRAASALLELDRFKEAFDACQRALAGKEESDFLALKGLIIQKGAAAQKKEAETLERKRRQIATEAAVSRALKLRNITVRGSIGDLGPHFDPTHVSIQHEPSLYPQEIAATWQCPKPEMELLFRVYFVYPEFEITEVITEFHELDTFLVQLARMFPDPDLPKDVQETIDEYVEDSRVGELYGHNLAPGMDPSIWRATNLQVYATLASGRTTRLGSKLTLGRVCSALAEGKDSLVLIDGALQFHILPKVGSPFTKKWLSEQKSTKSRNGHPHGS